MLLLYKELCPLLMILIHNFVEQCKIIWQFIVTQVPFHFLYFH